MGETFPGSVVDIVPSGSLNASMFVLCLSAVGPLKPVRIVVVARPR